MKRKFFCIYLPIILGVTIYIIFRSKSLLYFKIFTVTHLDSYIIEMRKFIFLYRKFFPNWMIYSLPDGLWLFSFGSALMYNFHNFRKRVLLFSVVFLLTTLFEVIQLLFGGHGTIVGTFDPSDMVCFSIGYTLAISINYKIFKKNSKIINYDTKLNFLQVAVQERKHIMIFLILAFLPTLT